MPSPSFSNKNNYDNTKMKYHRRGRTRVGGGAGDDDDDDDDDFDNVESPGADLEDSESDASSASSSLEKPQQQRDGKRLRNSPKRRQLPNHDEAHDGRSDSDDDPPLPSDSDDEVLPTPKRRSTAFATTNERQLRSKTRAMKQATAQIRRSAIQDDDDDDEEEEEYDEAKEELTRRRGKLSRRHQKDRNTKRSSTTRRGVSRRTRVVSSAGQDFLLLDSDDDGQEETLREEPSTTKSRRLTARRTHHPVTPGSSTRRRSERKTATTNSASYKTPPSYTQDCLASLPSPKRSSAIKARQQLRRNVAQLDKTESDQDFVDSEEKSEIDKKQPLSTRKCKTKRRSPPTKRKVAASSDEEFVLLDSSSDSDGSRDSSFKDEMDDDIDEVVEAQDQESDSDVVELSEFDSGKDRAVNIDNEQVGTADDSSDDNDDKISYSQMRTDGPGKKEILPSPRKGTYDCFDSSSDEDEPITNNDTSLPSCPSKLDAITAEELPRRHICCISPDGQSRVCFQLETLRQIALQSSQLQLRVDLDGTQRQNFLQPPHFRTAASDDLLDQIASRYGRGALDLHGPFYNTKQQGVERHRDDDSSDEDDVDRGIYELKAFRNCVERYFQNTMGSQDLYVCPLCYCQSHRSIVDPEADDDDETVAMEGIYDPMHVLGDLDSDEFEIASLFCFVRASDVKKHLRSDHMIDTKHIEGNDLFMRYKIRAPDGLLQRWLARKYSHFTCKQGYMMRYWSEGNSQNFILLVHLMKMAKFYAHERMNPETSDEDREIAESYLGKARDYYDSFASIAHASWKLIASPFAKGADNMKDFIVADEEVEQDEEEETNYAAFHRKMTSMDDDSDQNDLLHKLQRKYADHYDDDDEADKASKGSSDDDESSVEELDVVYAEDTGDNVDEDSNDDVVNDEITGYYSPIEEENDEWMLSKLARRKRQPSPSFSPQGKKNQKRPPKVSGAPSYG